MENMEAFFPKDLYPSYIIEGNSSVVIPELLDFLSKRGYKPENNSDILCEECDSFSMNRVSIVKDWYSEKSVSGGKKFCIIGAKFINRDAEQTFLKILEDMSSNMHMFLIVPDSSLLLDTVLSRSHIVKFNTHENDSIKKTALNFLKMDLPIRLKTVADIIENHKNDEDSGGLRYFAINFINEIENIIHERFHKGKINPNDIMTLRELNNMRSHLSYAGSSPKMILESISIML